MADWRPSPVKAAKYKIVRCLVGRHQDGARGDHCACTMADPKPLRVLSLLSASTEIVYRLGCGHLLVGRSHGCDDPPLATTLPVATAPQIDPNAPSAQIDEAVRAQSVAGGPVHHIHAFCFYIPYLSPISPRGLCSTSADLFDYLPCISQVGPCTTSTPTWSSASARTS